MTNPDNRSVHTDALATLGTVIDETAARDAIHLAVEPAIAGERLSPGEHVRLVQDGPKKVAIASGSGVGIVDPFLPMHVQPGQRFWLVVYPRTITSLRHVWEHPEFDRKDDMELARAELETYARAAEISVSELMAGAKEYLDHGEFMCDGSKWEGFSLPRGFWEVYERATGEKAIYGNGHWGNSKGKPVDKDDSFFSCSC